MLRDFFIFNSNVKKYVLVILALLMLILCVIHFLFKGVDYEFIFLLGVAYLVIFYLIKNERFPLFPSIVETSSNIPVLSRFIVLVFIIVTILFLSIKKIIE